jgi:hypothetical protein
MPSAQTISVALAIRETTRGLDIIVGVLDGKEPNA